MVRKKLSIGVQNIQDFARENMIYVDKTKKTYELMQLGKHNFIIRPRRFGKSLLLDTIASIYEGSKEQFVARSPRCGPFTTDDVIVITRSRAPAPDAPWPPTC